MNYSTKEKLVFLSIKKFIKFELYLFLFCIKILLYNKYIDIFYFMFIKKTVIAIC